MNIVNRFVIAVVLAVGLAVPGCQPVTYGAQVGNTAPDFTLQNMDGQSVSLSDYRGKPVLVNFWATWCPPCRRELPYLEQIYVEWSDRGLVMLAIDVGESKARVAEFLEYYDVSIPVLLDTYKNVDRKYIITAYPTTFFIDKDGIIQDKVIGAFPNTREIEKRLDSIIP